MVLRLLVSCYLFFTSDLFNDLSKTIKHSHTSVAFAVYKLNPDRIWVTRVSAVRPSKLVVVLSELYFYDVIYM